MLIVSSRKGIFKFLFVMVSRILTFEVFTNCLQYENDNIANFVLALPLKMNKSNEVCNLEIHASKDADV